MRVQQARYPGNHPPARRGGPYKGPFVQGSSSTPFAARQVHGHAVRWMHGPQRRDPRVPAHPPGPDHPRTGRLGPLAGALSHPGIVTVHDLGQEDDGTLYLVTELLYGTDLAARLRADTPWCGRPSAGGRRCRGGRGSGAAGCGLRASPGVQHGIGAEDDERLADPVAGTPNTAAETGRPTPSRSASRSEPLLSCGAPSPTTRAETCSPSPASCRGWPDGPPSTSASTTSPNGTSSRPSAWPARAATFSSAAMS